MLSDVTVAYMSPEQAKGKTVDKRTDIWALGCILYELLTAKSAFAGESTAEIIGSVLTMEPDWSALPKNTPASIVALLRRCLRKDTKLRPKDAGDLKIEIEEAYAVASPGVAHIVAQPQPTASRRWLLAAALACLGTSIIVGLTVWKLKPAPVRPVERVAIALPPNETLGGPAGMVAFSPDGKRLVYSASGTRGTSQLYLRAMEALQPMPIPGTEGAFSFFFSPDSQWIGFFQGRALKKISVSGGAAITLCSIPGNGIGGTWSPDGIIVFGSTSGLKKVSAAGGEPQPFTKLQSGEGAHGWPQFLPDGKTVLFSIGMSGGIDNDEIAAQKTDSTERTILVRGGLYGRYVPTGHLLYYRAGTVIAIPFDSERLSLKGDPAPVLENVTARNGPRTAEFSFSSTGSLAYVAGGASSEGLNLIWVDRHGMAETLPAPLRPYNYARLSPDGRQLGAVIQDDMWIYDLMRDTLTRFTFDRAVPGNAAAVWTPDGKRVVFPSSKGGRSPNLFWKPADGSGAEERLTTSSNPQLVGSISPDGRYVIYTDTDPKTGGDLWVMPLDGDRKPRVFLQTPFRESSGLISPDGRWVAYGSDESGRLEIYVRPFSGSGGKWQVSTDGGSEPAWSPKGDEIFYRTGPQLEKMMAVEIQTQPTFSAGKPRLLFEGRYLGGTGAGAHYSVSPDGQRFLMVKTPDQPQASSQINVVLNWFRELQERVPVK
jgi:serine/threonine-protein kinase